MRRLYLRCNDGHMFLGESCPFDGWGSPDTAKLARFLASEGNGSLTVDGLRRAGFSDDLLRRVLIIEFGDEDAVFQGIAPEYYFINGALVHRDDVDPVFR